MGRRKKNLKVLILAIMVSIVGIGYAIISTNFEISGLFNFRSNSWNVYFDNIVVDQNSVNTNMPSVSNNTFTFNASLANPDDFYSFSFDVVNESTVDAMVENIEISGITGNLSDYVDVVFMYNYIGEKYDFYDFYNSTIEDNNTDAFYKYLGKYQLKVGDKLLSGSRHNIVVGVVYKNIDLDQLPTSTMNLDLDITLTYKQADKTSIIRPTSNYWTFESSENEQEFVVPVSSKYLVEAWGAQGTGNPYNVPVTIGGYGGYTVGVVSLAKGDKLYIHVGETDRYSLHPDTSITEFVSFLGGGATYITKSSGLLPTFENNLGDIYMVSGGGGGNDTCENVIPSAGGYTGNGGYNSQVTGGTQSRGGYGQNAGTFGLGGASYYNSTDIGAAGGDGFYGGGGSKTIGDCGGGGSSYYNTTNVTDGQMYCFDCSTSTSSSYRTISVEDVSSNPIARYAKMGAGYVRITYLGSAKK